MTNLCLREQCGLLLRLQSRLQRCLESQKNYRIKLEYIIISEMKTIFILQSANKCYLNTKHDTHDEFFFSPLNANQRLDHPVHTSKYLRLLLRALCLLTFYRTLPPLIQQHGRIRDKEEGQTFTDRAESHMPNTMRPMQNKERLQVLCATQGPNMAFNHFHLQPMGLMPSTV